MLTAAKVLERLDSLDPNSPEHPIRLDAARGVLEQLAANDPGIRTDAAGTVWFRRELERIMLGSIAERFPEMKMADGQILPIRDTIPEGYRSATYYVERLAGVAKWVAIGTWDDIPRADVYFEPRTYTRERVALGYGWDNDEIKSAQITGRNLQGGRSRAARRGIQKKLNDVGLYGDDAHGYYGIFSHPNMAVAYAAVGGSGEYTWTNSANAKTVAEIKRDIILLRSLIRTASNNVFKLGTVYYPPSFGDALTITIPNTGVTARQHLQEAFPEVRFVELDECETGGSNGGPCLMGVAAGLSPEELWLEATEYKEVGPHQENPFRVQMAGFREIGGVICTQPRALAKVEFPATP